jgi:hypothetical protein
MTFNIGSQSGGVINNVAGDQRITGGQRGVVVAAEAARAAVQDLLAALDASSIDEAIVREARGHVEEIDAELAAADPDRPRVAGRLERLTRLLVSAGSLATAGTALIGPLQTLAGWLGTLGEPVLRMLPQLA